MEIKCKGSKRFLLNINIETYYSNLKKVGVDITTPIELEIPCQKCKQIEVYQIYPTHYNHIKSYKRNVDNNK